MASRPSSLSDLPPEILRDILNGPESSWAALELWKAGDRTLNAKLVNYGVTNIDLRDNRAESTSRWPRCLTEFKLERLSIVRAAGPFYPVDALRKELQRLHSGLKALKLYIPGVLEVVLPPTEPRINSSYEYDDDDSNGSEEEDPDFEAESYGDAGDAEDNEDDGGSDEDFKPSDDEDDSAGEENYSHRPKRSKTQDAAASNESHQTLWDLGLTWPTLEHLELSPKEERDIYGSDAKKEYGARALALLPRTLTWLELPTSAIKVVPELLPPSLKTLRLLPKSLTPKDLRILPKTITDLHLSVYGPGLALLNSKRELLPALKSFPMIDLDDLSHHLHGFTQPIYDGDATWPKVMVDLKVYMDDDAVFDTLPKSLTSFTSEGRDTNPTLFPPSIINLPRGLVTLSLSKMQWHDADVSHFTHWPSTLTALSVRFGNFNLDCFHLLPRSLKSLIIGSEFDDYGDHDVSETNSNFEALCKFGREYLAADGQWPSTKLEILRRTDSAPLEALESYVKSIESGRLFGLPLTLTRLEIPDQPLINKVKLLLPPKMTELCHQQDWSELEDDSFVNFVFDAFPPTTSMHFTTTLRMPAAGLTQCLDPNSSPTTSPLYLASSLTSLNLTFTLLIFLDDFFKYLPRGLLKLEFSDRSYSGSNWTVSAEGLKNLPSNLKKFSFGGFLKGGLEPWAQFLPPTLETLSTPRIAILGRDIKDLPRTLKTLSCSFFEVQMPQVLDLPRSLASLAVNCCGAYQTTFYVHGLPKQAWDVLINAYRPLWRIWEAGIEGIAAEVYIVSKNWPYLPGSSHPGVDAFMKDMASNQPVYLPPELDSTHDFKYDYSDVAVCLPGGNPLLVDHRTLRRFIEPLEL